MTNTTFNRTKSVYVFDASAEYDQAASLNYRLSVGVSDSVSALRNWRLWSMLGWNDVVQRYRRSFFGPFWITLSMAIFTLLLGIIYSYLFKTDPFIHLPYVAMGLVSFNFVSGTTSESCGTFTGNKAIIEQIRLPYTLHVLRGNWRNFVILFHTIVLILPIYVFTPYKPGLVTLLVIPGLLLLFLNQLWLTIVVSVLSTRYRDIQELVDTIIRISMFATPIMWPVSALGPKAGFIADVNPLYHLIELVRAPLLGTVPAPLTYIYVITMCVSGSIPAAYLLYRAHRRLVYWL